MLPKINKNNSGEYVIEGELNNQTVPAISQKLHTLLSNADGNKITFDLALVSRSDSTGVALLVEAMQLAKTANLSLLFINLPQQMQDIAGISGLLEILPINKN